MAISQDVLKVVPDDKRIPSGYLFAFLSSKYGLPMVVGGTFGSIVVHIEAANIVDLPVPRLGETIEQQIHGLVEDAAKARSQASRLMGTAIDNLEKSAGLASLHVSLSSAPFDISVVSSKSLSERFDAFSHSLYHRQVIAALRDSYCPLIRIGDFAKSIIEPLRFKRVPIQASELGVPFFGTSSMMWIEPQPSYHLPKRMAGIVNYLVDECTVLVPRSGQLNGLIGTAVLPIGDLIGGAITEDAIRINCHTVTDAGYLLISLHSEYGRRQVKARAFGSSIPHLNVDQLGKVLIFDLDEDVRLEIGSMGAEIAKLRNKAIQLESEAIKRIEGIIEGVVR